MTEEEIEKIGRIVDRIRNSIAASKLGLPAEQKLDYTLKILREIQSDLRIVIAQAGGEDYWEGRDREIQ